MEGQVATMGTQRGNDGATVSMQAFQELVRNLTLVKAAIEGNERHIEETSKDLTGGWLVLCGAISFFMQAGFAMLETGVVAKSNAINVLFKNAVDVCVAGIFFWLVGYAFAFGHDYQGFIGNDDFALSKLDVPRGNAFSTGNNVWGIWFFRWTFCGTATTIASGSVCERIRIFAYLVFSAVMSGFIYPVVVHWVWGSGFLSYTANFDEATQTGHPLFSRSSASNGVIDFAGSGVVHMVGGLAGLMGAISLGPRLGRFDPITGMAHDLVEHNVTLMVLGVMMLWFAWYGFNCGSVMSLNGNGYLVAKVATNTTIAASSACLTAIVLSLVTVGYFDVILLVNGLLTGLVSSTASCAIADPWMSCIIGAVGCLVYAAARRLLLCLRIDDPMDASAVHAFGGAWGLLAAGIFCTDSSFAFAMTGSFEPRNRSCASGEQFGLQVVGVLCIGAWSCGLSFATWQFIKYTIGLRVIPIVEEVGLDLVEHGRSAFGDRRPFVGWAVESAGVGVNGLHDLRYDPSEHGFFSRKLAQATGKSSLGSSFDVAPPAPAVAPSEGIATPATAPPHALPIPPHSIHSVRMPQPQQLQVYPSGQYHVGFGQFMGVHPLHQMHAIPQGPPPPPAPQVQQVQQLQPF